MNAITIEEYNTLVNSGRIIDSPVRDNAAKVFSTLLHEEDDVKIFRIHDAIALYWGGCGHLNTVYVA